MRYKGLNKVNCKVVVQESNNQLEEESRRQLVDFDKNNQNLNSGQASSWRLIN